MIAGLMALSVRARWAVIFIIAIGVPFLLRMMEDEAAPIIS